MMVEGLEKGLVSISKMFAGPGWLEGCCGKRIKFAQHCEEICKSCFGWEDVGKGIKLRCLIIFKVTMEMLL